MALTALIPVNRLERAKGRLEGVLGPAERRALAEATLLTVHEAARAAGCRPVVLTADPAVAQVLQAGSVVLEEAPGRPGLNPQLEWAIGELGVDELLILHADLPLATGAAIRSLLDAAPESPSATLAVSGDAGTNVMLLRPPGRFALRYGRESAGKHLESARAAGFATATVQVPELSLDLDTPGDIEAFMATGGWRETRAGKVLEAAALKTTAEKAGS